MVLWQNKDATYFCAKVQNHASILANHVSLRIFATKKNKVYKNAKNTKDENDYAFHNPC